MSVNQEIASHNTAYDASPNGGVDPFAIVGGLIVTILTASLVLWFIGADEIKAGDAQNAASSVPAITAEDRS